ncbi:hypothetical protein [Peptostreptococcus anaerobius]|uniref:hypothetical protein n=1 Tax=Peptostreptococcus anaerobius TaxID=1261 RepID=UPI003D701053
MISVNGVNITPYIKTCKTSLQDLDSDSSVRNVKGEMMRDRIAVKRKLELEFCPLENDDIKRILGAISGVFFSVTFIDPLEGEITRQMYCGDRSAALYNSKKRLWSGLKFNLIER